MDYIEINQLEEDQRCKGKIKWYIKPIIFGGNPKDNDKIKWINIEEHIKNVIWWNDLYINLKK